MENPTIEKSIKFTEEKVEPLDFGDKTPTQISEEFLEKFRILSLQYQRDFELVPSLRIVEIKAKEEEK